ncbi:hypothetical protein [Aminipila luticellarii]|uniref:Uncharacterized protein n=1 Tax=Aminipila luticellarii TaxID=2507160 RepID=A0A410PWL4_9FIRM|nr:hypothetical protein [Aminipila luticellarii]QAT43317.1 hypothetical protein EQM06_08850 [Aminipila luticellarii]
MKNHSCHTGCTNGLASVCGTSINLEDLDFAQSRNHLLYVNKVYSKGQGTASPLVFDLTTSPATFQTQLLLSPLSTMEADTLCEEILGANCGCNHRDIRDVQDSCDNRVGGYNYNNYNCNCNCNCNAVLGTSTCQLDENSDFEVLRSRVNVTAFELENPACLNPHQVTVDGYPVDSLFNFDGSYEAVLNSNLPEIVKDPCTERGLPTKSFFLISCVGPWVYQAEFIVEGTVTISGNVYCFRATFKTCSTSPICANIPVTNIAVNKISIPCASGGMSPRIMFSFDANMNLLNPTITAVCNPENGSTVLTLNTSVVVEPTVDVQVLKQALLCLNGCEALFPCEGTESEVESEEEDIDEECQCGTGNSVGGESTNNSGCGCRNNSAVRGTNSFCSSCFRGF